MKNNPNIYYMRTAELIERIIDNIDKLIVNVKKLYSTIKKTFKKKNI